MRYNARIAEEGIRRQAWTKAPSTRICGFARVHYYSTDLAFYNYPYAFGGLLARGLYEMYLKEGTEFLPKYKAMLRETPALSVEDSAKDMRNRCIRAGISGAAALEAFKKDIELFRRLVK